MAFRARVQNRTINHSAARDTRKHIGNADLRQVEHRCDMMQSSDEDAAAGKVGDLIALSRSVFVLDPVGASAEAGGREQGQNGSIEGFKTDFVRISVLGNNISATRDATAMLCAEKLLLMIRATCFSRTASRYERSLRHDSENNVSRQRNHCFRACASNWPMESKILQEGEGQRRCSAEECCS